MKAIKFLIILLLMEVISCYNLLGQNMTTSPYSMFGIGELETGVYGANAAMGGLSYGMRSKDFLNCDNPASLTALDSLHLIVDLSVFAKNENYKSAGQSNSAISGNFSRFALGGRILKHWFMAAGLTPYSSVGYYFQSDQPLEGTSSTFYTSAFDGSGGLSKIFLSNAFTLSHHWSVGVNVSYIFGNLLQTESQSNMAVVQKMAASSFYADFGVQYSVRLAKETAFTLGAVYGYRQKLPMNYKVIATAESGSSTTNKHDVTQFLPEYYGVGAGVTYKKMIYGLDYVFRKYSLLSSLDGRIKFRDTHELKAGVCFAPSSYTSDKYWKRIDYKAGVSVSNSYMRISNKDGINFRISFGAGLPLGNSKLNAALFYDKSTFEANKLNKDVFGLSITYTLNERFFRGKLD